MFDIINRNVLILFPKKPFYDWVNFIYPNDKIECPAPLAHDEGDVFLVPEFDQPSEAIAYLKDNYIEFFEQQLFDWTTDESLWPKNLSWDLFESWFYFSFQSMVMDTLDKKIEKDF